MEFLKKMVGQRYANQLYGSPLDIIYTLKHGESPNTTAFTTMLLAGF